MKSTILISLAIAISTGPALAQQAPPSPPAAAEYRLQPGDAVDVRFFFNPEINEQGVQIRPDGRISLQLIGDVVFAGRTVEDVSRGLETAFANSLKTPRVSIQVRAFAPLRAFVSGEVPRPGTISLAQPMTLLAAIGEAGGITIHGDHNRVVLIRKLPDGKPGRREIHLFLEHQPTADALLPLEPFDVVLVPESKIARVDRWVDQCIRQMIPVNMAAGFTYLWQNGVGSVVAPF